MGREKDHITKVIGLNEIEGRLKRGGWIAVINWLIKLKGMSSKI